MLSLIPLSTPTGGHAMNILRIITSTPYTHFLSRTISGYLIKGSLVISTRLICSKVRASQL